MAVHSEQRRGFANPWRIIGWSAAVAAILLPAVAMQFTREVNWTPFDFIFAIVMIGGTGLLFELAVRGSRSWSYRAAIGIALAAGFLTIWVNLAVGIIGDEDNPANLMFFALVGFAIVASLIARFRASAMLWAMAATAVGQLGIAGYALSQGMFLPPLVTIMFTVMWTASALLFRQVARDRDVESQ